MSDEHKVQDQLIAELEMVMGRLAEFRDRVTDAPAHIRSGFEERRTKVADRAEALGTRITDRADVQAGTASAVEDLTYAVDTLEADLAAATDEGDGSLRARLDRQLRTWRARADHLRVQSNLAGMDVRDELEDIGTRLAAARASALVELQGAADDTREVVIDLRDDVEEVLHDVRRVVERAVSALLRDPD